MGGCPYEIHVYKTQIEIRAGIHHLVWIKDKSTVEAAVNLMIAGGDLGQKVWAGEAPFQSIAQAIQKHGAPVDGVWATAHGFEAEIAQGREALQQEKARKEEAKAIKDGQQRMDEAASFGRAETVQMTDPTRLRALLGSDTLLRHACNSAFTQFDKNQDGVLQPEEIQALVASLCGKVGVMPPRPDLVQKLFEKHDTSHDGLLQADEFEGFYRSVLQSIAAEQKKLNPW
jgi:hypothetical protein